MPSDLFFTQNPADYADLEGLYVTFGVSPAVISDRNLNMVAVCGQCARGPVALTEIESPGRFLEVYSYPGAAKGDIHKDLTGKPFSWPMMIRRVAAAAAVKAFKVFANVVPVDVIRAEATSPGAWGNSITVAIEAATDANANHFNIRVTLGGQVFLGENANVFTATDDNLATIFGNDISAFVTVTKLANGRPLNAVAAALATGAEGSVAAGDYTSAITDIVAANGPSVCWIAGVPPVMATANLAVIAAMADVVDRVFLVWSGLYGQTSSQDRTAKAAQIAVGTDRVFWGQNPARYFDPATSTLITLPSVPQMASILSQNAADVHPGSRGTAEQTKSIKSLENEALSRGDLKANKKAGISTLEKIRGKFVFHSAVMTDGSELVHRRIKDFIILSLTDTLWVYVKEKNTPENRAMIVSTIDAWLSEKKKEARYVEDYRIDNISVNSATKRARGEEHVRLDIEIIKHILSLVLDVNVGTGVITEATS